MLYESDWQAADAFNYLDFLGATAFAWEFLRREPTYQADYQSMVSAGATASEMSERVAHRGLECAVDPTLRADCAEKERERLLIIGRRRNIHRGRTIRGRLVTLSRAP